MAEWKLGEGRHGTPAGLRGHEASLLERCEDKGGERAGSWQERGGRKVSLPSPVGSVTPVLQRAEVSRGAHLPYLTPHARSPHSGKVRVWSKEDPGR